jgi:hypothetical protein
VLDHLSDAQEPRRRPRLSDHARRMIHDAVESEVAIARDVGASRREGRRARRGMLRVRRIRTALPGPQDGR